MTLRGSLALKLTTEKHQSKRSSEEKVRSLQNTESHQKANLRVQTKTFL